MPKDYKISIIIPVYNSQIYLKRCLKSICEQTLKDIEIICVDDCSTDNSQSIIEEYAKNYQNVKILNLEKNQGVSSARNYGIAMATGEYLAFVDSDDELDLDFYERLHASSEEGGIDIIKGQTIEIGYDGRRHVEKQIKETDSKFLFIKYLWSAIYKRSMIEKHKISFLKDHSLGEDLLFINQAIIAAQNIKPVNDVFYHYYRRKDSLDSCGLSSKKIESALNIFEKITDNINNNKPDNSSIYGFIFHHFIISCFYISLKNDEENVKKLCAKIASRISKKCQDQDALQISASRTAPHLFTMLKHQDYKGVENILKKSKSRMDIIASGLRARIKNKV